MHPVLNRILEVLEISSSNQYLWRLFFPRGKRPSWYCLFPSVIETEVSSMRFTTSAPPGRVVVIFQIQKPSNARCTSIHQTVPPLQPRFTRITRVCDLSYESRQTGATAFEAVVGPICNPARTARRLAFTKISNEFEGHRRG